MYLGENSDQEKIESFQKFRERKKEIIISRLRITLTLDMHPFYIVGDKRAI